MKSKRKVLILIITVLIIGAISTVLFFILKNKDEVMNPFPQMNQFGEDIVMAIGLTSTGMTEEECDLDFLETQFL